MEFLFGEVILMLRNYYFYRRELFELFERLTREVILKLSL